MLRFERLHSERIEVYDGTDILGEIVIPKHAPAYYDQTHRWVFTAAELRAIADKLDELNGVKS